MTVQTDTKQALVNAAKDSKDRVSLIYAKLNKNAVCGNP